LLYIARYKSIKLLLKTKNPSLLGEGLYKIGGKIEGRNWIATNKDYTPKLRRGLPAARLLPDVLDTSKIRVFSVITNTIL